MIRKLKYPLGLNQSLCRSLHNLCQHATGNATGDRWRVEVEPRRYIVGIGKHGSLEDRIETTKRNLIGAINRASNLIN